MIKYSLCRRKAKEGEPIIGEVIYLKRNNKDMGLFTNKLKNHGLTETDSRYHLTDKLKVPTNFLFGFKCADHN